jgi:hypothetical protein
MKDEKLISKIIKKHLSEVAATGADALDDGESTIETMAKTVWDIGYPTLRDVFAQRIQLDKGQKIYNVPVPEKKTAGSSWTEAVDFVKMTFVPVEADQKKSLNFGWDHEYLLMATWGAIEPQLKELGRSIEEAEFSYCLDQLKAGAEEKGLADPTTYALFIEGIKAVNVKDYECDTCLVSVETYFELLTDDKFIDASVIGTSDPIRSGKIATTLGVTVYSSSVIPEGDAYFFDSKKALALVQVADRITEEYAYPDDNLYGVVGRTWFGAEVILPQAVAIASAS